MNYLYFNLIFCKVYAQFSFGAAMFLNLNKPSISKAFTPPTEKNVGTKWSFVKEVNECPAYTAHET